MLTSLLLLMSLIACVVLGNDVGVEVQTAGSGPPVTRANRFTSKTVMVQKHHRAGLLGPRVSVCRALHAIVLFAIWQ
eukprot:scaffold754_cov209-Alexandrium_tamarense.AAC.6